MQLCWCSHAQDAIFLSRVLGKRCMLSEAGGHGWDVPHMVACHHRQLVEGAPLTWLLPSLAATMPHRPQPEPISSTSRPLTISGWASSSLQAGGSAAGTVSSYLVAALATVSSTLVPALARAVTVNITTAAVPSMGTAWAV
jgi:hypothetical protein